MFLFKAKFISLENKEVLYISPLSGDKVRYKRIGIAFANLLGSASL